MTKIEPSSTQPPNAAPLSTEPRPTRHTIDAHLPSDNSDPHPRRWLVFFVVASAMLMGNIDQTVVATALPTLHHSLHVTINWIAWTVTIYQLGLVIALPVVGRLSDQFGRKRVFLFCIVLFSLSSLACGLANNIAELIVFRAIQAIGAGGFMPSATGIVADHFGRDRDRGVGLFASFTPIGALLGPVLGGVIINYWTWRGVFFINVPISVIVFVLAVIFVPRSPSRPASRADFLGIALLAGLILPMMYGITALGNGRTPIGSPLFVVPEIVAVCFGFLLVRHTNRIAEPIIPISLLRVRSFATMNVVNFMYGGCMLGFGALLPLYAEERYHFAPFQAGSVLTPRAIGVMACSGTATYLLRRTGYRRPMVLGFSVAALGMFLLGFGAHGVAPFPWLASSALLMGAGAGIAIPATNNALLFFSTSNVASISGLRGMFKQVGAIIAISVTTSFAARSAHPGLELGHAFIGFAIIVLAVVVPLVLTVPEHRGTW